MRPYSGSWFPLWGQGFRVACHPPCTDEPRIPLSKEDIVKVTRWKKYVNQWKYNRIAHMYFKWLQVSNNIYSQFVSCFIRHWLYGDKVVQETSHQHKSGDTRSRHTAVEHCNNGLKTSSCVGKRVRGWFPRQCAVEVISNEHCYEECKSKSSKQSRSKASKDDKSKSRINGEGKKDR